MPTLTPPASPTKKDPEKDKEKRRFHRLSDWLRSANGNKLTKEKPLPPKPPERPGTPLKEETFREAVTISPSRQPPDPRNQPRTDARNDYRSGRQLENGYGARENERQQAWGVWLPNNYSHSRSQSEEPVRPISNPSPFATPNRYVHTPSPDRSAHIPYPQHNGRVFSTPPTRDAYTNPSPTRPPIQVQPGVVVTPPPYVPSQTLQYALADSPDSPSLRGRLAQGIPMPIPMMPLPDAFAAMSLNPTPRSAPPETLAGSPVGFGQSGSAVSLNATPSPTRARRPDEQQTPRTPVKFPARRRSNSSPASANASPSTPAKPGAPPSSNATSPAAQQPRMTVQCAGITKAGLPCQRQVKALSALAYLSPDEPVERYCHQHAREVLEPSGFYTRPASPQEPAQWIAFSEWIPPYLSQDTQILLRTAMEALPSVSDQPGYIYAYELRTAPTEPVALKVGRAVNVKNRLGEWSRQCSKEVVLRGLWPPPDGYNSSATGSGNASPSLMRVKLKPGQKTPYCHKLERLIHLELADISLYSSHLRADFFSPSRSPVSSGPTTPIKSRSRATSNASPAPASPASAAKGKPARRPMSPCEECGKLHREIFTFDRIARGKAKGREWEEVVWPVIERWGKFAELVYG